MRPKSPLAESLGPRALQKALGGLTALEPLGEDQAEEARGLLEGMPRLEALEAQLGLLPGELDPWIRVPPPGSVARTARPGEFAVVSPDWRSLPGGALEATLGELRRGRPVVLLADEIAPAGAEAAMEALLGAGIDPRCLCLSQGTRVETLQTLLGARGLAAWSATGSRGAIRALRQRLDGRPDLETRLSTLRAGVLHGDPGDDPVDLAGRLLRAAFGRHGTLGGLLPGQVTRAWIPARLFSEVTGEILRVLRDPPSELRPARCPDPRIRDSVELAIEEGLDEGATLLLGADPRARSLGPTVFTNVEPHMGLAQSTVPRPVLALLRLL